MRLFSIHDAAKKWGLAEQTIRRYCREGLIPDSFFYRIPGSFAAGRSIFRVCRSSPGTHEDGDSIQTGNTNTFVTDLFVSKSGSRHFQGSALHLFAECAKFFHKGTVTLGEGGLCAGDNLQHTSEGVSLSQCFSAEKKDLPIREESFVSQSCWGKMQ